jgi:hypothetical protein
MDPQKKRWIMGWKCPECGIQHEDILSECSCGYSFYKILGIKPGVSGEEARQAYNYLLKVWTSDSSSHDPVSKKKAQERLRKINEAYGIFKKNLPGSSADLKKNNLLKITAFAGAILLIFLLVMALYSNVFKTDETPGPQSTLKEVKTDAPALPSVPAGQVNTGQVSGSSVQETSQTSAQPAISGEMTEEMAIEIVKKSHALYRNTSTEALIKKWSEENAAKFQIVGWNARKMDEEIYLVSYTAMDGAFPKGFYFILDVRTGEVENLENKPELQKKYNIQYSK